GGGGAMPEIQAGSRSIWIRRGADALQPDQPTVVFVHGAGGSSLTWIYQIRALRKRLNCVAIDLPGHGKSADDTDCDTISAYAEVVRDVMETLPHGSRVLVGDSMGGGVVLDTLAHAVDASAVVLFGVGPTIPVSPLLIEALRQTTDVWSHLMEDLLFCPTTPRRFVDKSTSSGLQASRSVVLRDFEASAEWALGGARIEVPALLIAGRDDAMVPLPLAEALG